VSSGCGSPEFANDLQCDDENNNSECKFDGGACCNNNIAGWDTYCTDCECLQGQTTTTTTTVKNNGNCGSPQWANDNNCDDENNNAECSFDVGACCNNNIAGWDKYCTDCECLQGETTTTTTTTTTIQGQEISKGNCCVLNL
jgi:hypothetical protein